MAEQYFIVYMDHIFYVLTFLNSQAGKLLHVKEWN